MFLNRRALLFYGGTALLGAKPLMAQTLTGNSNVHSLGAAEWMDRAIEHSRGTLDGTLQIGRFGDHYYYLVSPISWRPSKTDQPLPIVSVPVGFVTDLASIPRVFWSLLPPDGDYAYAAILHDYLYWTQTTSREIADQILRAGMADFGVPTTTIALIYNAVRLGGGSAWKSNAELVRTGEKRVLQRYPTDPRTKWKDWKRQPDVLQ